MSNAMSLKARIRNLARQKKIPAQVVLQNYMFERLLIRLSASPCKDKFVLKGGMLVAAMLGSDPCLDDAAMLLGDRAEFRNIIHEVHPPLR